MTGAFAYLIWSSTRNRLLSQIRRVKNPRYALALIVGVAYFWFMLFRPSGGRSATPSLFLGPTSEALAPLVLVLFLAGTWLFGSDRTALAFSQAEVSMLFTAPITRRALIAYKLVRAQISVLFSAFIWVFLLRRGNKEIPALLAVVGMWVLFTTLNFHRLGAALIHASSRQHRVAGARRNWFSIVLMLAIFAVILAQMFTARAALAGGPNPSELLRTMAAIFSAPSVRIVLYPFRIMLGPTFAGSVGDWGRAMLPALGVLAIHAVWVLRTDTAFEEAAAEASADRARRIEAMRARRTSPPSPTAKSGARTIPLPSAGHPAVAVVWKNTLCLMRTSQVRLLLAPIMMAVVFAFVLPGGAGGAGQRIALMALIMAGFLMLLGSRSLRNDLRSDMAHLPLLKSLPLRGVDVVLAEVASGALPMAALQFALLVVAGVAFTMSTHRLFEIPPDVLLGVLVAAPVALLALNATMFAIVNGTAVLFPAWVRIGPSGPAGVEAMGQNLLAMFGSMLGLAVLLILPGLGGGIVYFFSSSHRGLAIVLAGVTGGIILSLETYGMVRALGRAFDRAEPSGVG